MQYIKHLNKEGMEVISYISDDASIAQAVKAMGVKSWELITAEQAKEFSKVKTPAQIQKELTDAVQSYMDGKAQEKGYDSMLTACTYATSTDPIFSKEGQACVEWRDDVWRMCYEMLAKVLAGEEGVPALEDLISEFPPLVWDKMT